jgi:hypothetical protein
MESTAIHLLMPSFTIDIYYFLLSLSHICMLSYICFLRVFGFFPVLRYLGVFGFGLDIALLMAKMISWRKVDKGGCDDDDDDATVWKRKISRENDVGHLSFLGRMFDENRNSIPVILLSLYLQVWVFSFPL